MNHNWQTKKLGEICDFQRGLTYSKKDEVDFSDNIVLRSNNIDLKSGLLDLSDLRYINNRIIIPDNKKVRRGSIIICTANGSKSHLGKIALIDDDYKYSFGGFMGQLTPNECIDSKYFFYNLNSSFYKDHLEKISSGANINNLKFSDLKDLEIPLPPLPEQKRLVALLDELFEKLQKTKENAKKNLANAKELFESYLQSIFTNRGKSWEVKRFDEVCVLQRGFDLPTRLREQGAFPLVSSNGITDFIDKWKVKGPGVVTGRSGTIGSVHIVIDNFWPLNTALYVKDFHDNDEKFIYYFLKQFDLHKYASGAGVPTLNRNNVHGEIVCFPKSISEQKSIMAKLDTLLAQTKKLESIYQQKLSALEELKKSILHQAFTGKL